MQILCYCVCFKTNPSKPFYTVGRNVNWYSHYGKQYRSSLKNWKQLWNPATWVRSLDWEDPLEKGMPTHSSILAWRIPWTEEPGRLQSVGSQSQTTLPVCIRPSSPTPGHVSGENHSSNTCTPVFIAALFTVCKTWKQPVSTDRWMDKEDTVCEHTHTHTHTHTHNGLLLSQKKEWNNAICSNIDGSRGYHTTLSKSEKHIYRMLSPICGIQNIIQMNLFTKWNRLTTIENKIMVSQWGKGGRDKLGAWD